MSSEWARTAEDIVVRRSKLDCDCRLPKFAAIDDWIAAHRVPLESPLLEARGRHDPLCWKTSRAPSMAFRPFAMSRDAWSAHLERAARSDAVGQDLDHAAIAGLDKPTTAGFLVDASDVTGVDVRKRSVAMVYQQFINYPSFSVYENIASRCGCRASRARKSRAGAEAAKLLSSSPI